MREQRFMNPLLAFKVWYLDTEDDVRSHIAQFIFLNLPDSPVGNRQFIEYSIDDLMTDWLGRLASGKSGRVVGAALSVKALVAHYLMDRRRSEERDIALRKLTDGFLPLDDLFSPVWTEARQRWDLFMTGPFSDDALDAWLAALK
jgi:hypothetical protein